MDGIPALTLRDLVIEVFPSEPNNTDGPKRELRKNPPAIVKSNMHNPVPIKHTKVIPTNIDHTPSSTKNSDSSVLYVFEDNEAVIKRSKVEVPQCDMYQGPTELLWIGCLTELLWTTISGTLTPNTHSQTF